MDASRRRFKSLVEGDADAPIVELLIALTRNVDGPGLSTAFTSIKDLDRRNFPLCMRAMDGHLRTNGRLNDSGRRQYIDGASPLQQYNFFREVV